MKYAISVAIFLGAICNAQEPVGGGWLHTTLQDPMFDTRSEVFSLISNNEVSSGIIGGPVTFAIFCSDGKWLKTMLGVPAVLNTGDTRSPLTDAEQQTIILLADGKVHVHGWNISAGNESFFVDHSATMEMVHSQEVRIQFVLFPGKRAVAIFNSGDIDQSKFEAACGAKKKRK